MQGVATFTSHRQKTFEIRIFLHVDLRDGFARECLSHKSAASVSWYWKDIVHLIGVEFVVSRIFPNSVTFLLTVSVLEST